MDDDAPALEFEKRICFREWLENNHETSKGIWVVFRKKDKDFTANDALEEALCFGWIDGLIKSIDDVAYKKYFAKRKSTSNWSDKNNALFIKLNAAGLVTEAGIKAHNLENNKVIRNRDEINSSNVEALKESLSEDGESLKLFLEKSPSRQKQFAGFYMDAKTEATRCKRKKKIVEALKNGDNGMLS